MAPELQPLVHRLLAAGVNFIVTGGWPAILRGHAGSGHPIEIIYERSDENMRRLSGVLGSREFALPGTTMLPPQWSERTIRERVNFPFASGFGAVMFVGNAGPAQSYEALLPHVRRVEMSAASFLMVELGKLLELRRAAGWLDDMNAIPGFRRIVAETQWLGDEQ